MKVHWHPPRADNRWAWKYPRHAKRGLEPAFFDWVVANADKHDSSWTCVPACWFYNSAAAARKNNVKRLCACEDNEGILRSLDPSVSYFSLSQGDDGLYEDTPPNLTLFCACCTKGVPIPLIYDGMPTCESRSKRYLASFLGRIDQLSRTEEDVKLRRSGNMIGGIGSRSRQLMRSVFAPLVRQGKAVLDDVRGWDAGYLSRYVQVTAESVFCLAPRGYGATSYRLYEALKLGAIPVYISNLGEFVLPWPDLFNWDEFCVLCLDTDLPSLPERLQGFSEAEIKRMQEAGREAAQKLCDLDWVFSQVVATTARGGCRHASSDRQSPREA